MGREGPREEEAEMKAGLANCVLLGRFVFETVQMFYRVKN